MGLFGRSKKQEDIVVMLPQQPVTQQQTPVQPQQPVQEPVRESLVQQPQIKTDDFIMPKKVIIELTISNRKQLAMVNEVTEAAADEGIYVGHEVK